MGTVTVVVYDHYFQRGSTKCRNIKSLLEYLNEYYSDYQIEWKIGKNISPDTKCKLTALSDQLDVQKNLENQMSGATDKLIKDIINMDVNEDYKTEQIQLAYNMYKDYVKTVNEHYINLLKQYWGLVNDTKE